MFPPSFRQLLLGEYTSCRTQKQPESKYLPDLQHRFIKAELKVWIDCAKRPHQSGIWHGEARFLTQMHGIFPALLTELTYPPNT